MARQSGVGASGTIIVGSAALSSRGSLRERWADRDFVPEAPDARDVVLQKTSEELGARRAKQRCVALHAAGHVEHHDETYGLRGVVELSNRLGRSFVANFEVLLLERRGQPSVSIRHGCEHAHCITSAAKNWWLLRLPFRFLGCADDGQGTGNQWRKRETSFHGHESFVRRPGGLPSFIARKGARSASDDRQPAMPDAETSVNWTMVGICAHQSALKGGEKIEISSVLIGRRPFRVCARHS